MDESKCTGCGDCAEVCPIQLPDEFEQGLRTRKAVHKPYAQAIPGAYAVTKRGMAPCKVECPAHISVQGYVALAAEGKYREALKLIKQENPLPAVCGRVCHHPCEAVCTRAAVDEPVAINAVKRFVADLDLQSGTCYIPEIEVRRAEKVAVIGSGPAGLSCAYYLAQQGYRVTIFEKLPVAGGMLAVGIPEYRLPRDILAAEIQVIREMGVEIRTGISIGADVTIEELRRDGFRAFLLGIGAQECKSLGIEGESLQGVYSGIDFLRDANLGAASAPGRRVAVIGGGNVAMDAVRTARRLGSEEAFVIYRRSFNEMPANAEEIEECQQEDIRIDTLTNPIRILGEEGKVRAVECVQMTLGEPDESGRRRPLPVEGSEYRIPVDGVIQAIGQEADWSCLGPECACTVSEWGTMQVDSLTLQTDDPDIFAGGDAVTGPKTVIEAIEAGKQAAVSIDRFLRGADLRQGRQRDWQAVENIPTEGCQRIKRTQINRIEAQERLKGFAEVQLGLSEEQAATEARRCIACGICSECYQCVEACRAGALTFATHTAEARSFDLAVGSIVLSPGFQPFDPSKYEAYGYSGHPNIITSMEFERILSASGPTMGHLVRPSDQKAPQKIAWIQCVGSREIHHCDHGYCSSVCCMYAIKEALIAKEHAGGNLDCAVFFMDMRTPGKDFEQYYNTAGQKHGIRFIRSRVPAVEAVAGSADLKIPYLDDQGRVREEDFDLVVLSVGLEISRDNVDLAGKLGIELTEGRFCKTSSFQPVATSREGIFACGAFQGPKDIPQSVIEASSAAAEAGALLRAARNTLTRQVELPQPRNIAGERPRLGVFVCQCGINIGGVVDVPAVRDYAASLPYVEYVSDNLYTCSQDTQETMVQAIKEKDLNRIVVAACTPKTHEPLFQETLVSAGLNKYLFEMTNIRNQDSWVHRDSPSLATAKAKDLVRMAVAKAALTEPLQEAAVAINQQALVIGGGIAGMAAARALSGQGYRVSLVERQSQLGGQARKLFRTWKGENVQQHLAGLMDSIESDAKIAVHLNTEVRKVEGFVGNFRTSLEAKDGEETVEHGVALLATGATELKPDEYLYGKDSRVLTHLELDRRFLAADSSLGAIDSAVFIQCVGSREPRRPYCSRVCCTHAIESALYLKELQPDMRVYIFYRDIRTYGEREYLYRKARLAGITFIPYSARQKPLISSTPEHLRLEVFDPLLGDTLELDADLLVLASAIVPSADEAIAQHFKVPWNAEGFFVEAHAKLGPSEFATDGVFLCGMAHYPKPIDESIAQAQAAASRASTLLARKTIRVSGTVARAQPELCSSCGVCVDICPYSAPGFVTEDPAAGGKVEVNPALCKGCGLCVASCRSGALGLNGFNEEQIMAMIAEI